MNQHRTEASAILEALGTETRMGQRQQLLKQLWRLQLDQAEVEPAVEDDTGRAVQASHRQPPRGTASGRAGPLPSTGQAV